MFTAKKANRFIFILLLFFMFVPFILTPVIGHFNNHNTVELSLTQLALLSQWGLIFIPTILYVMLSKSRLKEIIILRKMSWQTILLVIALGFTVQPIVSMINVISQLFVHNQIGDIMMMAIDLPYWQLILLFAVTPAIVEEFIMRGVVLANYRYQTIRVSCLINGLIFGIFHMNVNQFLYAFFLGVVFAFVLHITESIVSTMLLHFIVNGTNVSLLKLITALADYFSEFSPDLKNQLELSATQVPAAAELIPAIIVMIPFFVIGIALSGLIIWGLLKHHNKLYLLKENPLSCNVLNLHPKETTSDQSFITFSLLGIIILFIVNTLNEEVGLHFIEKGIAYLTALF